MSDAGTDDDECEIRVESDERDGKDPAFERVKRDMNDYYGPLTDAQVHIVYPLLYLWSDIHGRRIIPPLPDVNAIRVVERHSAVFMYWFELTRRTMRADEMNRLLGERTAYNGRFAWMTVSEVREAVQFMFAADTRLHGSPNSSCSYDSPGMRAPLVEEGMMTRLVRTILG